MPAYGAFSARTNTATRWSFLIDKKGVIRYTQHTGINQPRDVEAMKAEVGKL